MTVARARVSFIIVTSFADGATESVTFSGENLGVVVTAGADIYL